MFHYWTATIFCASITGIPSGLGERASRISSAEKLLLTVKKIAHPPDRRAILQHLLLRYSGGNPVKRSNCVQHDEFYNTFVLRYSGTEWNIGFPFASGKSPTPSSCATVGKRTFFRRTRGFSREGSQSIAVVLLRRASFYNVYFCGK